MKNIYLFLNSYDSDSLDKMKNNFKGVEYIHEYLDVIYSAEKTYYSNKNTFGKFHPFCTIKLIKNINICFYIYYIPKIFNMDEFAIIENDNNRQFINKMKCKFKNYYSKCLSILNKKSLLSSELNNNKNDSGLIELELDYKILLKIKKNLLVLNSTEIEQVIYSEFLEGEINQEFNMFNHNKGILIQNKSIRNEELFNAMNSFIKIKFNNVYERFMIDNKNNFHICSKILNIIKEIKILTEYSQNNCFYNRNELLKLFKDKFFLNYYTENKEIFICFERLLSNKISLSKDLFKRQSLQMDKIWEIYVNEILKKENKVLTIQSESIFQLINFNNGNIEKKLKPDIITDLIVGDAKYKIVTNKYLNSEYYQIDYNKLLRDCIYHKKKNGVLFFPKKEGVSNMIEIFNSNGLEEYNIEIKEIEFIYDE